MSIRRKLILPLLLSVIVLGAVSQLVIGWQLEALQSLFIESLVQNKITEINGWGSFVDGRDVLG